MRSLASIRNALLVPAGVVVALYAPSALAHGQSKPHERSFQTTGGAVECQIEDGGTDVDAYCQTTQPPRSVTLSASGKTLTCSGATCIGAARLDAQAIVAGGSVTLGPFSCSVMTASVSCRVGRRGGFSISPSGVKAL
jgi:hypothetical protein